MAKFSVQLQICPIYEQTANKQNVSIFLLGITTEQQMDVHPLRGSLFENMVINDMLKLDLNRGNNMQQLFNIPASLLVVLRVCQEKLLKFNTSGPSILEK